MTNTQVELRFTWISVARYCHDKLSVRPSVCPSVMLVHCPCKFRYVKSVRNFMWKLCYGKDRAMRPIRGCPENFWGSTTTPTARPTIPRIFHGLLFRSTLWMFLQNLKSVALPVPGIIGEYPKKFGQPLDKLRPRSIFSKIFNGLLFELVL